MNTSTAIAEVKDPTIALRLSSLDRKESILLKCIESDATSDGKFDKCMTALDRIGMERALISMASAYNLSAYATGPAVVLALEIYYGAGKDDPDLWAKVVGAMHAFIEEAAGMAGQRVAQEKDKTTRMAEETKRIEGETAAVLKAAAERGRQAEAEAAEAIKQKEAETAALLKAAAERERQAEAEAAEAIKQKEAETAAALKIAAEKERVAAEETKLKEAEARQAAVIAAETKKREKAKTKHEAAMATQASARAARHAKVMADLDVAESKARTERATSEAAEAEVRRRRMKYDTYSGFWRAFHNIDDVE
jgi:hypothetical protein